MWNLHDRYHSSAEASRAAVSFGSFRGSLAHTTTHAASQCRPLPVKVSDTSGDSDSILPLVVLVNSGHLFSIAIWPIGICDAAGQSLLELF
jgi:hypothetical protein